MTETATTKQHTPTETTATIQKVKPSTPTTPSILPSIKECERFFTFLNKRFNLGLDLTDLIVLIHETHPNTRGFFRSVKCDKIFLEEDKSRCLNGEKANPINSIVLSSYILQAENKPYTTLAHELAHYINFKNGVSDCSNSQYHNKHFKKQAEKLLLSVERTNKGYSYTTDNDGFLAMLQEFKPDEKAFKIFQNLPKAKTKKKSRMLKYICDCGYILRSAKGLKATCDICESKFIEDND